MLTVMTGGSSGLGRVAAGLLATRGGSRLVMGVRAAGTAPAGWAERPLDLASLASVRAFAADLPDGPITTLVLNAGAQRRDVEARTVDGFETTFATNHLAHFLLLRLLEPRLANGARIVMTSSATHDPAERAGLPPPRHAHARQLAYPETDPALDRRAAVAGMRAYSSTKLCNLLTARCLAQSDGARRGGWHVFAYDPGLTPGTGLVRAHPWAVRTLVWPLLPLIRPFASGMNSLADAGRGLFDLATTAVSPPGRVYASLRKGKLGWPDPSELARDDTVMTALWQDSETLTGLR
jgi:NAD(P)-dependent dehydrogenase (short-subunit alcohol dehydrogenase family)